MKKRVSVIIPFYENFIWLEQAIESAFEQSYKNFEIIVVNDGSLESDEPFLTKYSEKIKYFKTVNKGPAHARNLGIEKATGEYIAFLDSDDLWDSNKLEMQVEFMENNNLVWTHSGYSLFDDSNGELLKVINVNSFFGDVFVRCLVSSPIATPCVMIKKHFLTDNSKIRFPENMRYGQDGVMWLNIAEIAPLGVIHESLSKVRIRGENAGLKARVYLRVKSQTWNFIKTKISSGEKKYKNLPLMVKNIYRLCSFTDLLVNIAEKKLKFGKNSSEYLSKVLYLPLYVILKILKYKLRQK